VVVTSNVSYGDLALEMIGAYLKVFIDE
jgi:hypothetical protein